MGWPIESDYFAAIQNPQFCFSDPELRRGQVTTNRLGLPKSITGAFASVYQLQCPNGKKWAVRCFLRDVPEQQRRYAAISEHLRLAKLPYMVSFEYLPHGILSGGHWFPILKMEWLEGLPLSTYIEKHLTCAKDLQALTKQWIEMMAALKMAKIAHGDLQHGNIVVCNDSLKLIDYDGMYVPALKGMHSNEQGHPNYQHPRRSGSDFNSNLDNFSAWLIFISLSTFAVEPRLWQTLNCGDENLLFRRLDFERPTTSTVFHALDKSGKPQLQSFAAQLRSLLCLPLDRIPSLDGLSVQPSSKPSISGVPDWLADHVPQEKLASLQNNAPLPTSVVAGADWIFDHLVSESSLPLLPMMPVLFERAAVISVGILAILAAGYAIQVAHIAWLATLIAVGATLLLFTFLAIRYQWIGAVSERKKIFARISRGHQTISRIESAFQTVSGERARAIEVLSDMDQKYRSIPQRLGQGLRELQHGLDQSLVEIMLSREAVDKTELDELSQLEASEQKSRADLLRNRNKFHMSEEDERISLLDEIQKQHVANFMQAHTVHHAELQGIKERLKELLAMAGVVTAADITDSRIFSVRGIGQTKAATLKMWRNQIEWQANHTAPSSLPAFENTRLRAKYAVQIQAIDRLIAVSDELHVQKRTEITEAYMRERQKLVLQENAARLNSEKQVELMRYRFQTEKEQLMRKFQSEKTRTDAIRKDLDIKLVELSQSIFRKRAELHQLQREYKRYQGVTLRNYVGRVLGLRRAV